MTTAIVIVGCGGFGREVFSIVAAINRAQGPIWTVAGFVDDSPSADDLGRVVGLGSHVLGPLNLLRHHAEMSTVIGVGCPSLRSLLKRKIDGFGLRFPSLVHPDATVGVAVTIRPGVIIAAGARLSTNIHLGPHVQIDQNATIGHDTRIGEYSRLNPQACVSGSVYIGTRVLIGANATILPSLSVGNGSTVGAQACVVRDVPENTVVKGIPAR